MLVDKLTPWFGSEPERGEVVVFHDPGGWLAGEPTRRARTPLQKVLSSIGLMPSADEKDLIKRVIAVGGDTVECKGGGPREGQRQGAGRAVRLPAATPRATTSRSARSRCPRAGSGSWATTARTPSDSRYHQKLAGRRHRPRGPGRRPGHRRRLAVDRVVGAAGPGHLRPEGSEPPAAAGGPRGPRGAGACRSCCGGAGGCSTARSASLWSRADRHPVPGPGLPRVRCAQISCCEHDRECGNGQRWTYRQRVTAGLGHTLSGLAVALGCVLFLGAFVWGALLYRPYTVPTDSMAPTIRRGDRVLAERSTAAEVRRGDVVVFQDSVWGAVPMVKRVVGVGRRQGGVLRQAGPAHGQRQEARRAVSAGHRPGLRSLRSATTVPEGRLFLLGDHRSDSLDSRVHLEDGDHGAVPRCAVKARVDAVAWPMSGWACWRRPGASRGCRAAPRIRGR